MMMSKKVRVRRGESGQAAVLAALCMFTMVVFVMLATNVGILASDRIRMQNVVDVAAYSGALEQARNLNILRKHNAVMMKTAAATRVGVTLDPRKINIPDLGRAWGRFVGNVSCSRREVDIPEMMLDAYQTLVDLHQQQMVLTLRKGQKLSVMAAQLTAEKNMEGLGFGRSFHNFRLNSGSPTFAGKPLLQPPDDGQAGLSFVPPELDAMPVLFNYAIWWGPCKKKCKITFWSSSCVKTRAPLSVDSWWYKKTDGPSVYFPLRLIGTPLKQFFDIKRIGGYFGASPAKPHNRISVFSVAKPFNGGIAPSRDDYEGAINGTKSYGVGWGVKKNLYNRQSIQDVYRAYFENADNNYRARMIGIQELADVDLGAIANTRTLFTDNFDPRNPSLGEFERMLH